MWQLLGGWVGVAEQANPEHLAMRSIGTKKRRVFGLPEKHQISRVPRQECTSGRIDGQKSQVMRVVPEEPHVHHWVASVVPFVYLDFSGALGEIPQHNFAGLEACCEVSAGIRGIK